jgi:hypothetical protein
MASVADEIDNRGLFLEQRLCHIFCSGKLSMLDGVRCFV